MSQNSWWQRPSAFVAILGDSWRETRDSKVLYVLLGGIVLLLGVVLTARFESIPGSKQYLQLAARACGVDTDGLDANSLNAMDMAGRLRGALYSLETSETIDNAEDLPGAKWRVILRRQGVPLMGGRDTVEQISERFGKIAEGRLFVVDSVEELADPTSGLLGIQRWSLIVSAGRDLRVAWPHRMTLFLGVVPLTSDSGAPLGLQIFILYKLLTTGFGAWIMLLVGVVVTSFFVPNMIRKGTLELLLVRPIPRWRLLFYKYLGGLMFALVLLVALVGGAWVATGITAGLWSPTVLWAVPILLLFFGLLYACSTLVAVITRAPVPAMLMTCLYWVALFIVGILHGQVEVSRMESAPGSQSQGISLTDLKMNRNGLGPRPRPRQPERKPFYETTFGQVVEWFHAVLPRDRDLDNLMDRQLVKDLALAGPLRDLTSRTGSSAVVGLGITLAHLGGFLVLACWIFSRRDP
jgi:ABC-type transport system involved in multi-copper enzyme maturation permease subunit